MPVDLAVSYHLHIPLFYFILFYLTGSFIQKYKMHFGTLWHLLANMLSLDCILKICFPSNSFISFAKREAMPGKNPWLAGPFPSRRADRPFPTCLLLYCRTRLLLGNGRFGSLGNRTNSQIFNLVLVSSKVKFWHSIFLTLTVHRHSFPFVFIYCEVMPNLRGICGCFWHLWVALFNHSHTC